MYTRTLLAGAILFASLSAQALGTVQLTNFTYDPFAGGPGPGAGPAFPTMYDAAHSITKTVVSSAPPTLGTYAGGGQMEGLLNGASFQSFCVQIDNPVQFGPVYTDYVPLSGAAGFGVTKAADLAKLITWASAGNSNSAAKSAALQAAVWEIVHETGGSYSFATGNVQASSANSATAAALAAIDWAVINSTTATYTVSKLDGATQDLLIFAPVPEAGTVALMMLGLAGVGAVARKRRLA